VYWATDPLGVCGTDITGNNGRIMDLDSKTALDLVAGGFFFLA
jgi:hypothetical protein